MISYQLLGMYLFVLLTALQCNITQVLSSTEEHSTLDDSHVYKTLSVNKDQCELICKEDLRCASYNYKLDKNAKEYCELNVCGMEEEHDISAALRKYRPSGSFIVSQTHQVRPVKNREQCKHKLVCPAGYYGDGLTCKDMDECRDGTHNCSLNANCTNTDGSFNCTCLEGYIGDGITCKACKLGWQHFNGYCFKNFDVWKSWDAAITRCESYGANLASIHSSEENTFIRSMSNVDMWIGLNDKTAEGTFTWVDGTPLDYENWNTGQPDNYLGDQDCTLIIPNKNWDDNLCPLAKPYVCKSSL